MAQAKASVPPKAKVQKASPHDTEAGVMSSAMPKRRKIAAALGGAMLALAVLIQVVAENSTAYFLTLAAAASVAVLLTGVLAHAFWRAPSWSRGFMLAAIIAAIALSVNDLLLHMRWLSDEWFYLQPYGSMLVFLAFGFAVSQRMVDSLSAAERMNTELERRIESVRGALAASEAELRRLEVESAVDNERQRLMREMHDGIGSNLVTALAAAQAVGESKRTIDTLRRCLTDLKMTVDTLEPFEGDVAALLANFRYRIEPQLKVAGLALEWRVAPVQRLIWLDAVSALHLLRILQEALGNVVAHARAATIAITVENAVRDAAPGVQVMIADDGVGLKGLVSGAGRGVANMHARAQSIGAALSVRAGHDRGVVVDIWLPAFVKTPFITAPANAAARNTEQPFHRGARCARTVA